MVPKIKEIRPELKLMAFLDAEALDQREIPVLLERTTEGISRHGSKSRRARSAIRNQGGRSETSGVEIVGQDVRARACCVHTGEVGARTREGSGPATGLPECSSACAVRD